MTHYLDIRVLPDEEVEAQILMSAVFARLHAALVARRCSSVGVSFPELKEKGRFLGEVLRLHGPEADLLGIADSQWLQGGIGGYTRQSGVLPVPSAIQGYLRVVRKQAHSSPERLRRRFMRTKGVSEEEALQRIPESKAKMLNLPFVTLSSKSTGQKFRLFIEQTRADAAHDGVFSAYGFSREATLPQF